MANKAFRRYAEDHNMVCTGRAAYGKVNGWNIILKDEAGIKVLQIYLYPAKYHAENEDKLEQVFNALTDCDAKAYCLHKRTSVVVEPSCATVIFRDTNKTMEAVGRYIDEVMPGIEWAGLTHTGDCYWCGEALEGDVRRIDLQGLVMPVHSTCMNEMQGQLDAAHGEKRTGSVLLGSLGALVGAVIGMIPWAVVYVLGYIAAIAGFVIGWLANWFYGKFGGKNSPVRIAAVLLALIIGGVGGQVLGETATFWQLYDAQNVSAESIGRCEFIWYQWQIALLKDQDEANRYLYQVIVDALPEEEKSNVITADEYALRMRDSDFDENREEFIGAFARNIGLGVAFSLLGCSNMFSDLYGGSKRRKLKELK